MRRSVLQAGAWTAFGLAAAFAVVSANSSHRRAATTAAPAKATVASASSEKRSTKDVRCARDAKVSKATFAAVTPRSANAPKTSARPTGVNGIVVGIDPESGELGMPTPEQMAELESMLQTLPDDVTEKSGPTTTTYGPNGSVNVNLQGRFQEFATVHIGPNGKLIFGCADRPALETPTLQPAQSALEEK